MEGFSAFIRMLVLLDAAVVGAALVLGAIIVPLALVLYAARWWKRRAKWLVVCQPGAWTGPRLPRQAPHAAQARLREQAR